ncbi:DNA-binding transcriptional MerR regulator [Leucobacter komagatae]|uniref:DNA-binding transcriptional MerR regulator n=1 Tax=Leucobacter komagatae TaxID=55969 RepID=A0A542Y3T8_9MICO|nr:MerR family transcriptional regulator [Leucobacter komagatae]TQL42745.1 DNA-binding transcriptional MerR regulator [Leucobacter komagatae]
MKISEVAERSGVPASTLRYYERLGILSARRSPNGYRDFDENHLERLDFIASAKRLGLELPEIRRLLELADDGTCTGVKAAMQPLLADQLAAVERQLRILGNLQDQLRAAQVHVDGCPDSDQRCRSECAFRAFALGNPTREHRSNNQ